MAQIKMGLSRRSRFNLISSLIMLVQRTYFSHAYIKIPLIPFDREMIFQASGIAVNFEALSVFNSKEIVVAEYIFEITDECLQKTIQFALDQSGKPYGILEFIGLGCMSILQIFGYKISNPFSTNKSYVCSTLVATILSDMGDTLPIEASSISPKDLQPLFIKYGQLIE